MSEPLRIVLELREAQIEEIARRAAALARLALRPPPSPDHPQRVAKWLGSSSSGAPGFSRHAGPSSLEAGHCHRIILAFESHG
jgi:hypothetical protein